MWANIGTFVLLVVGVAVSCFAWWLIFNLSDPRVKRNLRPRTIPPLKRQDYKAYREANAALVAIILMIMGTMLLVAAMLRLGVGE